MKIHLIFASILALNSNPARAEGVNCQTVAQAVAGIQSQGNLVDYSDAVLKQIGGAQGDALIALRKKALTEKQAVRDVPFSSRGSSSDELSDRVWRIATTSCAKELRVKVEEVIAGYRKCRASEGAPAGGVAGVASEITKRLPVESSVEKTSPGLGANAGK